MRVVMPLYHRYVVRRLEDKQTSPFFTPESAKEKPQQGEIIAVGSGRLTEDGRELPLKLKLGDRVLFAKYVGTEWKLNGEDVLFLSEDEILGSYHDEETRTVTGIDPDARVVTFDHTEDKQ